jgi:DNA adenine methylase
LLIPDGSQRLAGRLQPLLKWAGGKRQLLPALGVHYPARFHRYIEPFFGSGAVFFDLIGLGRLDGRPVRLTDINPDLIGCYATVRDDPEAVIAALEALACEHEAGGDDCYYDVRDRRFNPARASLSSRVTGPDLARRYTPELAAMLIFLNRTGFNGLFRLNRDGAFNVPAGRYARPKICDADLLRRVAATFRRDDVTLACVPFDTAIAEAGAGDFVYCDPPYAPLTRTACFAHYTAGGFGAFDQARLQRAVLDACARGASVVVSNSSAQEVLDLYDTRAARRAGLEVHRVPARRAINSRADARGPVDELIISNVRTTTGIGHGKLRMAKATTASGSRRARTA